MKKRASVSSKPKQSIIPKRKSSIKNPTLVPSVIPHVRSSDLELQKTQFRKIKRERERLKEL